MEEEYLEDDFTQKPQGTRPTFILVLAILSWIWVGMGIFNSLAISATAQEDLEEQAQINIEEIENTTLASSPYFEELIIFTEESVAIQKRQNIVNLILLLIEGLAIFMIYNLKKNGFWLYLATQIGFIATLYYFLPWPNMISTLTLMGTTFMVVLFLILYGVNYKHLKSN